MRVEYSRVGLIIEVKNFEISFTIARNDWSLALLYWPPLAVSLSIGPLSVTIGWRNLRHFYGVGVAMIRTLGTWRPAAYLSDRLWWERNIYL